LLGDLDFIPNILPLFPYDEGYLVSYLIRSPRPQLANRAGTYSSPTIERAADTILRKVILERGTFFGPYEVVSFIGAGGVGEVYRARDTRLGREVAVKITAEERFSDRFEREARTVAALTIPIFAHCTMSVRTTW
jgi:serine/threonine protein kinase